MNCVCCLSPWACETRLSRLITYKAQCIACTQIDDASYRGADNSEMIDRLIEDGRTARSTDMDVDTDRDTGMDVVHVSMSCLWQLSPPERLDETTDETSNQHTRACVCTERWQRARCDLVGGYF